MVMLTRVVLSVSCVVFVLGSSENEFRSVYETANIIQSEGYVSETHGVLTTDNYMLEMHRIPYKRNETTGSPDRPVVFLMHGLMAASNSYISLGPKYSISYNLADAGFDVWMGNARGTRNSRQHMNLDPDNKKDRSQFFDFSWEEIGYHDIANMIDYILKHTNNNKLHYIGHSQGGTVFLVLNSMRPDYNDKILSAHLLAGVGYMQHFPNRLLRSLAMFTNTIYTLATRLKIVELFPPINITIPESQRSQNDDYILEASEHFEFDCAIDEVCRPVDYCTGDPRQKEMCELFGIEEIMSQTILDIGDLGVGGAALKQIAHYGQNIQDKAFRRWNYGSLENFQKYGNHLPPIYNISLITVNTTMHYTVSDNLLDEQDVLAMCADMPNCIERKVARESFQHVDFIAAGDVKELVTDHMIQQLWDAHKTYLVNNPPATVGPDGSGSDGCNVTNVPGGSLTLLPSIIIKTYISILILYLIL